MIVPVRSWKNQSADNSGNILAAGQSVSVIPGSTCRLLHAEDININWNHTANELCIINLTEVLSMCPLVALHEDQRVAIPQLLRPLRAHRDLSGLAVSVTSHNQRITMMSCHICGSSHQTSKCMSNYSLINKLKWKQFVITTRSVTSFKENVHRSMQ